MLSSHGRVLSSRLLPWVESLEFVSSFSHELRFPTWMKVFISWNLPDIWGLKVKLSLQLYLYVVVLFWDRNFLCSVSFCLLLNASNFFSVLFYHFKFLRKHSQSFSSSIYCLENLHKNTQLNKQDSIMLLCSL